MSYEITSWKQEGCVLALAVDKLTDREPHSREINEAYGEGGALNANYRTAEAIAVASNYLGKMGLRYGHDFVFKTVGSDLLFDFRDDVVCSRAQRVLTPYLVQRGE